MKIKLGNILTIVGICFLLLAGGMYVYNEIQASNAYRKSNEALNVIKKNIKGDKVSYRLYPNMEMPVVNYQGKAYIGVLSLVGYDIELPILAKYNESDMMISPCAYYGTIYDHHMVIGGHNYSQHFGKLGLLKLKDKVVFEDVKKNIFKYEVIGIEQLHGNQNKLLINSEADLTLFTCTLSGMDRIVIRCMLVEDIPYKKE